MSHDDKRKLNCIYVEPATHAWLVEMANSHGEMLGDFAGMVLDDISSNWTYPTNEEPQRLLRWNVIEALRRKRQVDDVYKLAAIYQELQEDALADRLQEQCELAGLAYEEVIERVGNDPFSSIIANSRDGSKFGQCVKWLSQVLRDHRGAVAVNALEQAAEESGFAVSMLKQAKRAINRDPSTPTIRSIKSGVGWTWVLEQEQEEEEVPY